jgi:hypothetical protein
VHPAIAKVVLVAEASYPQREDVLEVMQALVASREPKFRIGLPVVVTANDELVKVGVVPPHGVHEDAMELPEREAGRHEKSAPDRRMDVLQRDLHPDEPG